VVLVIPVVRVALLSPKDLQVRMDLMVLLALVDRLVLLSLGCR